METGGDEQGKGGTDRMSSNSPSGGMNEIDRSESNLPSRTHWWNWQSSSSTAPSDFDRSLRKETIGAEVNIGARSSRREDDIGSEVATHELFSSTSLSLSPNLHSGVPDR